MLLSVLSQKLVRSCRTKRPAPKKDSLFLVSSVWKQQIAFPFRDLGEFSWPLPSGRLGVCPTHASVTFFSPWPSWSGLYSVYVSPAEFPVLWTDCVPPGEKRQGHNSGRRTALLCLNQSPACCSICAVATYLLQRKNDTKWKEKTIRFRAKELKP